MERPLNTAGRDRAVHAMVEEYLRTTDKRHTPVTRVKVTKEAEATIRVAVYTSRPTVIQLESAELAKALSSEFDNRQVRVDAVPEARAVAKFVRVSPRKARLVLDQIKGKRVSDALAVLPFVPNRASEPILKVLKSAVANAADAWGAGPQELKVASFIADGGPILKRIRARAQGRAFRIFKRTSHLTVILTEAPAPALPRKTTSKSSSTKAVTAPAPAKTRASRAPAKAAAGASA